MNSKPNRRNLLRGSIPLASTMIVKIQPVEQWTGRTCEEKAVYLDVPASVDLDNVMGSFYYGENYALLVEELVRVGAKIIDNPIRIIRI